MAWAAAIPLIMQGVQMYMDYKNRPKNQLTKPNKGELTLSESDLSRIRAANMDRINMMNQKAISTVKQSGAANRMPSGAIASGVANVNAQAARQVSAMEPGLASLRNSSMGNYYGMLNNYDQNQNIWNLGMHNRNMDNIGALGKIASLWAGGAFSKPQTQVSLPYQPEQRLDWSNSRFNPKLGMFNG